MDDTISRQAAIDAFDAQIWGILNVPISKAIRKSAQETIKQLPPAQQDIIRCKDCKHYQEDHLFRIGFCDGRQRNNDDFCSRAERKDNDGT